MRRETRNNLIFLALLLALMAPGAVILFNKKSQPGERPIGSPDPVRRTTAYMDPYPAESVERLAPVLTAQWVGAIALGVPPFPDTAAGPPVRISRSVDLDATPVTRLAPSGGSGNVGTSAPFKPIDLSPLDALVVSEGRWFQVISAAPQAPPAPQAPAAPRSPVPPVPDRIILRVIIWDEDADPARGRLDARTPLGPAPILATHRLPVPRHIRHNLQDAGYVSPPQTITLMDLDIPADVPEITVRYEGRHRREQTAQLPPYAYSPASPPGSPDPASNR